MIKVLTSLTALSTLLEAIANISVLWLKDSEVAAVTKFIIALRGLGFVSLRQSSWLYTFTTPELHLEEIIFHRVISYYACKILKLLISNMKMLEHFAKLSVLYLVSLSGN